MFAAEIFSSSCGKLLGFSHLALTDTTQQNTTHTTQQSQPENLNMYFMES